MNIIITAGGTSEQVDQVRKITNMATGTLGRTIYRHALDKEEIKKIHFIGPDDAQPSFRNEKLVSHVANSTNDVAIALEALLKTQKIDFVIHSMAISDYTVDFLFTFESLAEFIAEEFAYEKWSPDWVLKMLLEKSDQYKVDNSSKVSSNNENLAIKLKKTEKIISKIKEWSPDTKLIGFKLLNNVSKEELISVAFEQQAKNKCDYVFANDLSQLPDRTSHFGYLITNKDKIEEVEGLDNVSKLIVSKITNKI